MTYSPVSDSDSAISLRRSDKGGKDSDVSFARPAVCHNMHALWNQLFAALSIVCLVLATATTAFAAQQNPVDPLPLEASQIRPATLPYRPITGRERLAWLAGSTVGPQSLAVGIARAGIQTAENTPPEYGGTWAGFGKRYGMRTAGVATQNAMEAGLGAMWGEDPRYVRAADATFGSRVKNIFKLTFLASNREGHLTPAYARYLAVPGSNFLSNTWRVGSESSAGDAALRTLWGFLGRMGSNAFAEFWPDVRQHVFRKGP